MFDNLLSVFVRGKVLNKIDKTYTKQDQTQGISYQLDLYLNTSRWPVTVKVSKEIFDQSAVDSIVYVPVVLFTKNDSNGKAYTDMSLAKNI